MQVIRRRYKQATATRRGRVIFFSILIGFLVLITGALIYWTVYKKKIIRDTVESAIREKSKGLYAVTYDSLKLDEVAGNMSVLNFTLDFDSTVFLQMLLDSAAPPSLLRIKIPQIIVTGVKTPRALIDNEIVGRKLLIVEPEIEILYTHAGKDSARSTPSKEVYEQILGNLDLIRVDTVHIQGGRISTRNMKTGRINIELGGADIRLYDVAVDSVASKDTQRMLFARKIDLACATVRWSSSNKLYNYGVDSIELHSDSRSVAVKKFFIQPTAPEDAFVKSLPTQDDRFDFTINSVSITGINFNELFNEEVLADTINIKNGTFKIYRDLNIVRDKKNRIGTYPHQAIAKIPIPVHVNRIIIQNAFVEYKERGMVSKRSGKVQFFQSSAVFNNLTNDQERIAKNNIMTMDFQGRFLNKTILRTNWKFFLGHKQGKFTVAGTLGALPRATDLNQLAEPMGPARIEDGKIHSLAFDFTGNDYNMSGRVKLVYEDLKIAVLTRDEDTKELEKRKLVSIVANLIAKNSNPSRKGEPAREVDVQNERDPNRSIFHLSWKTLFKGVQQTVGIKK